jgi:adenylate cyclase
VAPLESNEVRRQLAAILSADAVGYSRHMAEDEVATVQALRSHRQTIGGFVREHRGRVVDAVGDNLLAEFASAVDAVACAIGIQAELEGRSAELPKERRLHFRLGVHIGEILVEGDQIFGDGINVASRLEGLADPGGICASGAIVEQVRGKVEAAFEDLGEHQLKNIPAPVRTYRVLPAATGPGAATPSLMTIAGFGGRPAIAILPFESRGSDPAHEHLADGIVEDLIARLSAFRLFPVISRSSTFTYKGRRLDARQISRELRTRYVVEGSVQRAGERIRVGVQLVDGILGHQIHSERYDRELGDVFALQDEIVMAIVGSIEPALARAERQRARAKPTTQLDAWECFQRGSWFLFGLRSKDDLEEAVRLFRRARDLDPAFSTPVALEAVCHSVSLLYQWFEDPARSRAQALEIAEISVTLGEDDPWAHTALGYACTSSGDLERAVAEFERAIELNPSLTMAYQGIAVALSSHHPDEAIRIMEKAIRLSPRDSQMHLFLHQLAVAHLVAGRYEDALKRELESLKLRARRGARRPRNDAPSGSPLLRREVPACELELPRRSLPRRLATRGLDGVVELTPAWPAAPRATETASGRVAPLRAKLRSPQVRRRATESRRSCRARSAVRRLRPPRPRAARCRRAFPSRPSS